MCGVLALGRGDLLDRGRVRQRSDRFEKGRDEGHVGMTRSASLNVPLCLLLKEVRMGQLEFKFMGHGRVT